MPENRSKLGKRFARSLMAHFSAKIGDQDSSQGHLIGIFWESCSLKFLSGSLSPESIESVELSIWNI